MIQDLIQISPASTNPLGFDTNIQYFCKFLNNKKGSQIFSIRNERSCNSQIDEVKEHVEEFKEVFLKAKDPTSSQTILEE